MGFVQMFKDKKVTMLKSTGFLAYPVHSIVLSILLSKMPCLIDSGHRLVVFLPVLCIEYKAEEGSGRDDYISVYGFTSSTTVSMERGVHSIRDLERTEKRMWALSKSYESGSDTAAEMQAERVHEKIHTVVEWKSVPLLASYCSDIPEGKGMSDV